MNPPREIRVLHCIPTLRVGGAERQLVILTHELPRQGVEVHLAYFDDGELSGAVCGSTAMHKIPHRGNRDPRLIVRIARLIRKVRPTLVQSWLPQMDVMAGTAAMFCRTPWVISERASAPAYRSGVDTALRSCLGRGAAGIIANSATGLRWWATRNRRAALHRRIPNAIAPPAVLPEPRLPNGIAIPPTVRLLVHVGRLAEQKNVSAVIAALAQVRQSVDAVLLVCGEGPLEPALRAQARAAGVDDAVIFAGFVHDVAGAIRRADAFVSASVFEGLPNAMLEAMALGTPVIASDIAEHREILDDESACFVDPRDPAAIARGIVATLGDCAAARCRAARARERTRDWTPDVIGAAYAGYYRELLGMV